MNVQWKEGRCLDMTTGPNLASKREMQLDVMQSDWGNIDKAVHL